LDELIKSLDKQDNGITELYLGTCITWNSETGVTIRLDGQDEPMQKKFKLMNVSRMPKVGERVIVAKMSGTYIVLGSIMNPIPIYRPADLPSTATLATVITKVNTIMLALRSVGTLGNPT
jgi:hypothetical protein